MTEDADASHDTQLERIHETVSQLGQLRSDDRFSAEQNALVAANAEEYYRSMVESHRDSWNVRDHYTVETLNRLFDHHGPDAKGIIWAHNTHVGDARATDMPQHGRINIGQLVGEQETIDEVDIVGFGSHCGEVIAGDKWGAEMDQLQVTAARPDSYEQVSERANYDRALLFSEDLPEGNALEDPRGHRAIGVVYDPAHEAGNYVPTVLPDRYDAYIHLDETRALHPIELHPERERIPELYPSGL